MITEFRRTAKTPTLSDNPLLIGRAERARRERQLRHEQRRQEWRDAVAYAWGNPVTTLVLCLVLCGQVTALVMLLKSIFAHTP